MILPVDLLILCLAVTGSGDLDDHVLAGRIKEGDESAFKTFFDRYHGLLFRYLKRRHVPDDVSEDLTQVAFITIWNKRSDIDEQKSLRAFLFKIAHNRALNFFRDTARFVDDPVDHEQAGTQNPEEEADFRKLQQSLYLAIQALPERRRAVFELCFLNEMTYRETAEILNISIKTVENQMGHALKSIRKALSHYL